jgi:hypothetical protein
VKRPQIGEFLRWSVDHKIIGVQYIVTTLFFFIVGGGLLQDDSTPKQAYYALQDLIRGWTTSGTMQTDGDGQFVIQGYGGDYALTITYNGQSCSGTAHITEQQEEKLVVECQ